ncbi:MAG TPA: DUF262 domain-containing protein [Gemmatimonadaceae bacterium]|nr:DUF262 domain-containing protein [Gemmatimonadaceae bacterium]
MIQPDEFTELLASFNRTYLSTPAGEKHLAQLLAAREDAERNFRQVRSAHGRGEDVTDLVILKLLPHQDTPHNRERGAWRPVAPTIIRDVKAWFEGAGWAAAGDWPFIAKQIFDFVNNVVAGPQTLDSACEAFASQTKGMQSAFLSPILNALRPDDFCVINSKVLRVLKELTGQQFKAKINSYPQSNRAVQEFVREHRVELSELRPDIRAGDLFDTFSHWYVALREKQQDDTGGEEGIADLSALDRQSAHFAEDWFLQQFPDAETRAFIAAVLAQIVERLHPHGAARWGITLQRRRVRVNAGRLVAFHLSPRTVRIGLVRAQVEADLSKEIDNCGEWREAFAAARSIDLVQLPLSDFIRLWPRMAANNAEFLAIAAATARRTPVARTHSPGVLAYLQAAIGRTLPGPDYGTDTPQVTGDIPKAIAFDTPRALFSKVDYELTHLLSSIDTGDLGLPDLQRPFVWSPTKVRDLFDSMYRGFPVGYLLFWSNSELQNGRTIGRDAKQRRIPRLVIVDGQQRLTSLYAVLREKTVIDDEFKEMRIDIAFRPRDSRFEVTDAAIRKDPEFIPSISAVWASGSTSWTLINGFFSRLESKRPLHADDKTAMSRNIDRLVDLQRYPFTALEIMADVEEEAIADIFVRINSEGVKLNQADFILTLLSVAWPEGREALEDFSRLGRIPPAASGRPSPFNYLINASPDQMLRVSVALGFHRARLKSVYQLLRGKDLDTDGRTGAAREVQFDKLREAQEDVLNLNHWHDYLGAIRSAGYRSGELISSDTGLLYGYAIYLIGKLQCAVRPHILSRLIQRWFIASLLTARYSGSSETVMEEDLNRLKTLSTEEEFVRLLERMLDESLTRDFWEITLPAELESSSSRNPAFLAYQAAQVTLGAPILFSDKRVTDVLDPALRPTRKAIDRHHLFPKAYLQRNGIEDLRVINQVANLAYVEWPENLNIRATPPAEYVPPIRERFPEHAWLRMSRLNAVPLDWHSISYDLFLRQRRILMAGLIRESYEALSGAEEPVSEGSRQERSVWEGIESMEMRLRRLIRARFHGRFGERADERIRAIFGNQAMEAIDGNREKYMRQYRFSVPDVDPILDFSYLGQLVQVMLSTEGWEIFRTPFRDKRELQDLANAIVPVRNDAAHFRSVPDVALLKCRSALADLAQRISSLEPS